MNLSRRTFFKTCGAAGAATLAARPADAAPSATPGAEMSAVLVDTTRCIGCRACEAACGEVNHLPAPDLAGEAQVFEKGRTTAPAVYTVVNRRSVAGGERFVKTQCMHCVEPACASACPARAIEKTAAGPIIYHVNRCLGCRYCMLACPFDIPRFEYESAAPYIRKCTFCADRQAEGLEPACTSVCPTGALTFGKRAALIEEARERIYHNPGEYERHVYGEREVGGTSWMYISDRPLAQLGLPSHLGTTPHTALAQGALSVVPLIITLWPPLLMGIYTFSKRREALAHEHAESIRGSHEEDRHA